MIIECPNCHKALEVPDDLAEGQHVKCPECGVKFEFFRAGTKVLDTGEENGGCCVRHRPWMTVVTGLLVSFIIVMFVADAFWGILDEDMAKNVTVEDLKANAYALVFDEAKPDGARSVSVIIKPKQSDWAFRNSYVEACGIIINPSNKTAIVSEIVRSGMRNSNVKLDYDDDYCYNLCNEDDFKLLKKTMRSILKSRPAKYVLGFVSRYR